MEEGDAPLGGCGFARPAGGKASPSSSSSSSCASKSLLLFSHREAKKRAPPEREFSFLFSLSPPPPPSTYVRENSRRPAFARKGSKGGWIAHTQDKNIHGNSAGDWRQTLEIPSVYQLNKCDKVKERNLPLPKRPKAKKNRLKYSPKISSLRRRSSSE